MKKEKLANDISIEWLNDSEELVITKLDWNDQKQDQVSLSTDALKKLGDFLSRALRENAIQKQKQRLETTRRIIRLGEK